MEERHLYEIEITLAGGMFGAAPTPDAFLQMAIATGMGGSVYPSQLTIVCRHDAPEGGWLEHTLPLAGHDLEVLCQAAEACDLARVSLDIRGVFDTGNSYVTYTAVRHDHLRESSQVHRFTGYSSGLEGSDATAFMQLVLRALEALGACHDEVRTSAQQLQRQYARSA